MSLVLQDKMKIQIAKELASKIWNCTGMPDNNSNFDYFLAAFFLPATVLRRPLRVREFVRVR